MTALLLRTEGSERRASSYNHQRTEESEKVPGKFEAIYAIRRNRFRDDALARTAFEVLMSTTSVPAAAVFSAIDSNFIETLQSVQI